MAKTKFFMSESKVIIALDFPNAQKAEQFLEPLSPQDCILKVGFELFVSGGPALVERLVSKGYRIFLDLKFHDIPNTVANACKAASNLGVWMMNLHASGGEEMMMAAREAVDNQSERPYLIAVTVLTSMSQNGLSAVGVSGELEGVVQRWAADAQRCGLDGVVCSAQEAEMLRKQHDDDFLLVTPGIRFAARDLLDDQKRVVTPERARAAGASYIVVGRPVTRASDPVASLSEFNRTFSAI